MRLAALFLAIALGVFTCPPAWSASDAPVKVTVGAYVNDIQQPDFKSNSYAIDLYVWFRWRAPDLDPYKTLEFMNRDAADDSNLREPFYDKPEVMPDGSLYQIIRYRGQFSTKFRFDKYPFDTQPLKVVLEDSIYDVSRLVYVPDGKKSVILDAGITLLREGLSGVEVDIGNDDPLWRAFAEKDSLDYLVPGYKAASLDFSRGRDKIQQFVKACETFGDVTPRTGPGAASGGDAEKEAFKNAKDLGTIEAWEAFVANYPSGFHADLARAYIKKLGSSEAPVAKTAPEPKPTAKKAKKPGCGKGQITVDGKCMSKQKAVSYCGPGYRPQNGKCVQGYAASKTPPRGEHGCPPGMAWNAQEGCHEDD
jgi:hypothetical protein